MKVFRGSGLALLLLLAAGVLVFWMRPTIFSDPVVEGARIFSFEKHELTRVEVSRPDDTTVVLAEVDGVWIIEATGHPAGRSMVNRVKHQIHDLTARAAVVEAPEDPERFGLGKNAIGVRLSLRGGRSIAFKVGDPNPTSVSYYIQPEDGDRVFTVQKAAVDYYSLTLDEFRERRFATFDSKDVVGFRADLKLPKAEYTLAMDRLSERQWQMTSPIEMSADDDHARRLLGRLSALKAVRFQPRDQASLSALGLTEPRVDMTVRFASRAPLRIRVGGEAPKLNRHDALAYVLMDEGDTVYVARSGMLKEFTTDPATMRNRRVVKMDAEDVVAIDATLVAQAEDPLSGEGAVRYAAEQWVWSDGVPVSGSTPKRVARRFAELEVDEFVVEEAEDRGAYGLDTPIAVVSITDREDGHRVVLIGAAGPPLIDPEGHEQARYYVAIEGSPAVYLVHRGLLEVVRDLVRESGRKAARDADKAARRERIDSALSEEAP
jgi:hypothetical protein